MKRELRNKGRESLDVSPQALNQSKLDAFAKNIPILLHEPHL